MANRFNIFIVCFVILVIVVFSYMNFKLNEKNNLLNQELQNVKNDYATKVQVPEIIFQKISQCNVMQVTKEKWNFNSESISANEVCQSIGKSCFSASMIVMEGASTPWNAFSKGNGACGMSLSKGMLQDASSRGSTSENGLINNYEVVCC